VDVETVGEHEHVALGQTGLNRVLIDARLVLVGHQDGNDVSLFGRLVGGQGLNYFGKA